MVQAIGKSSDHGVKKNIHFYLQEMSYFSSQTSTLILPTFFFYFEFFWVAVGAQNAPKRSINDQVLRSTFETVPRFVLYINFVVVLTLLMTHFIKYICIKHIRRG